MELWLIEVETLDGKWVAVRAVYSDTAETESLHVARQMNRAAWLFMDDAPDYPWAVARKGTDEELHAVFY